MKKTLLFILLMTSLCVSAQKAFVTTTDGHFVRDGKPYYFVGTNMWYGAILGSEGQGGNRQLLCRELDLMKKYGIDNIRILAADLYNDTILAGMDFLLAEMAKRQMVAVLYLNNSWEWSRGYGYYLEQAGAGKAPRPTEAGYPAYMDFVKQFSTNKKAQQLFFDYVRSIVSRTNSYTGKAYRDDPTIMSWQIGNEPRAFGEKEKRPFAHWLAKTSALIRSLDPNHLISIGSEGSWGCENDIKLYEKICADRNIDYCNIHLWPYNWGWVRGEKLMEDLPQACKNTKEYIDNHLAVCERLRKPLVMEEFGYPRDDVRFERGSSTDARNAFYRYVFRLVVDNARAGGMFAGCNFWAWGGYAQPAHKWWQTGDDYCGDPAQEEQGLNSVFSSDTETLEIISKQAKAITADGVAEKLYARLQQLQKRGYMFGHQDDPFYGLTWEWERGRSDVLEACGDYPAIMGFDLGGIEVGDEKNLDSVPFTRIREELLAHVARGGIVTVSWHPRNPLTGGTAWDNKDSVVVKSVLPGGSNHRKFLQWMKNVRNFLLSLKDEQGNRVPLIFRPWHENNGAWFWWGARQCTPEEYHALWCMLQDYLVNEGLDNMLWSYSPNLDGNCSEEQFLVRYPGDNRVDVIGLDAYQWGTEQDYVRQLNADLKMLCDYGTKQGKLVALTECGLKNLTDPTWWTSVIKPQIQQYPLSYFLVWRNAKHEYFGPAPGEKNTIYFNEMIKEKNILMLKDINK